MGKPPAETGACFVPVERGAGQDRSMTTEVAGTRAVARTGSLRRLMSGKLQYVAVAAAAVIVALACIPFGGGRQNLQLEFSQLAPWRMATTTRAGLC